MDPRLSRQDIEPRSGEEMFVAGSKPLGQRLLDFWRWSASDLLSNTQRGILAEYIVMLAVCARETVRDPWAPHDLETPDGVTVEVKSTCSIQSWAQKRPSPLRFGIKPTAGWNPETGETETAPARRADAWVFCVLETPEKGLPDPMDVTQWKFYVVSGPCLDDRAGSMESVSLSTIKAWGIEPCAYEDLAETIARLGPSGARAAPSPHQPES